MLNPYEKVQNVTAEKVRIYDPGLSGGFCEIEAGATYALPRGVYQRIRRKHSTRLRLLTPGAQATVAEEPEPEAEAEAEPETPKRRPGRPRKDQ